MPKSLEDAIGCWTTNPDWNTLPHLAKLVAQSARASSTYTKQGRVDKLQCELEWLRKRMESMQEVVATAQARLNVIMQIDELIADEVKQYPIPNGSKLAELYRSYWTINIAGKWYWTITDGSPKRGPFNTERQAKLAAAFDLGKT